jgi:hypothetical protein
MKKFLALLLMVVFVSYCEARPPGGGFRSSSSRSSSARSSSSTRSSGWGSKATSTPSASKPTVSGAWGSKSAPAAANTAPKSAVDNAAYKAAKTSGKAFTTKDAAVADFKAKSATKYTSTYKTEPTTRPSHIPTTTTVGGSNVNVSYNSQYGGYGYMHPSLGTWMMYDMISDAAMMGVMMSRDGYYVGAQPAVIHHSGGPSTALSVILTVVIFGTILAIVCIFIMR